MYSFVHSVWKQIQQLWRKLKCSSDFSKYYLPHGFCLHRFFFIIIISKNCFVSQLFVLFESIIVTKQESYCTSLLLRRKSKFSQNKFSFRLLRICSDLCLTTSNLLWSLLDYFEFVMIFALLLRDCWDHCLITELWICSNLCLAISNLQWSVLGYFEFVVIFAWLQYVECIVIFTWLPYFEFIVLFAWLLRIYLWSFLDYLYSYRMCRCDLYLITSNVQWFLLEYLKIVCDLCLTTWSLKRSLINYLKIVVVFAWLLRICCYLW